MLKLENINITFNKNTANERKALQHIDLDVADGDFVTVIGSNGAGKSTLMNVISGSYEADTGKIFLDGKNITHLKEHQRARTIGRLFQDPLRGQNENACGLALRRTATGSHIAYGDYRYTKASAS